jgi:hypothetical protein
VFIYATVIYAMHRRHAAYERIIGSYCSSTVADIDPDPGEFVLFELMDLDP